jgi:hypothetical protein
MPWLVEHIDFVGIDEIVAAEGFRQRRFEDRTLVVREDIHGLLGDLSQSLYRQFLALFRERPELRNQRLELFLCAGHGEKLSRYRRCVTSVPSTIRAAPRIVVRPGTSAKNRKPNTTPQTSVT